MPQYLCEREVFTAEELMQWELYRQKKLSEDVHRISPISLEILNDARATPKRLLALSKREIRDPDWRSGFEKPCSIVIRDMLHDRGRLGAWEECGYLCVEVGFKEATLIVQGAHARLRVTVLPETICTALIGRKVGDVVSSPFLITTEARIDTVETDPARKATILSFNAGWRDYCLTAD